jgi:hypothetical protein
VVELFGKSARHRPRCSFEAAIDYDAKGETKASGAIDGRGSPALTTPAW